MDGLMGLLGALGEASRFFLFTPVPILPCQQQAGMGTLQILVRDPVKANAPVVVAWVTVTASDGSTAVDHTDQHGTTRVMRILPGTYRVSAQCLWHLPDPSPEVEVTVREGQHTAATIDLEELRFYLHVDADRDGVTDAARSRGTAWTWGAGGRGAVVLCNNDDDNAKGSADNANAVVDGAADVPELAVLRVRAHGSAQDPPESWNMTLGIPGALRARFRIFDSTGAAANEVVGSATGAAYRRSLRGHGTVDYGMEAVSYAQDGFDGLVDVTLEVRKHTGEDGEARRRDPAYTSAARLRVAPWIMPTHADRAETVYVAEFDENLDARGRLAACLDAAGPALHMHPVEGDRWMQDCMEIGYTNSPGARIDAVVRARRGQALADFPETLRGADFGYVGDFAAANQRRGTDFDGMGNLEVTPPCRAADGTVFPLGRIYYGHGTAEHPFDPQVLSFLRAQVVQRPFAIDTSWLRVGHADEMITFVPYAAGPDHRKWKALIASPRRAYQILDGANPDAVMLRGVTVGVLTSSGRVSTPMEMTVNQFLNAVALMADVESPYGLPANHLSGAALRAWNTRVQARIDQVLAILEAEIGLDRVADVIEVPVIFHPENEHWNRAGAGAWDIGDAVAVATSGDMVNMLVVNGTCIVPEARGPVDPDSNVDLFQDWLENALVDAGLGTLWIDCWEPYHEHHGEIHCGTNTLRRPADVAGWLANDPRARWWSFAG
ncbi:protein-arginine deiminase family protein [Longimicrobium sp.]|uniref:protein-arginine deiminase family protein n=1 Tax=Longimicrobium sp. TaxID=2029185 RepID=UPI002B9FB474|nr:protein-arginine deiminase family protein [Longimicrobium sp.]HSU14586.1 protein-arginine deiminase family protein [Longimicrobium sp.]